ncbi:MAG TPA: Flp family type IVb pilin [Alphaproteobacteria bacterium]|nr:Flp family type IVb pilin [Alphaproteobacteria bacterium]
MRKLIQKLSANRNGATAIEYGLIAGLIAVVIVAGVTAVGTNLKTDFGNVQSSVPVTPAG